MEPGSVRCEGSENPGGRPGSADVLVIRSGWMDFGCCGGLLGSNGLDWRCEMKIVEVETGLVGGLGGRTWEIDGSFMVEESL